jgi:hypothetical protein
VKNSFLWIFCAVWLWQANVLSWHALSHLSCDHSPSCASKTSSGESKSTAQQLEEEHKFCFICINIKPLGARTICADSADTLQIFWSEHIEFFHDQPLISISVAIHQARAPPFS